MLLTTDGQRGLARSRGFPVPSCGLPVVSGGYCVDRDACAFICPLRCAGRLRTAVTDGGVMITKRHPLAAGLGRLALILPPAIGLAAALAADRGGAGRGGIV